MLQRIDQRPAGGPRQPGEDGRHDGRNYGGRCHRRAEVIAVPTLVEDLTNHPAVQRRHAAGSASRGQACPAIERGASEAQILLALPQRQAQRAVDIAPRAGESDRIPAPA